PAPGMTPELRQQMGLAAVAAAKAVHYVGAGTVEFIVEQPGGYGLEGADAGFAAGPPQGETAPSGGSDPAQRRSVGARFFFMEMNTRLQVEHPVTEAITGLDLVEWQLRVASGEPLPLQQHELCMTGHAIDARLCAENPDHQVRPATGTLNVYRKPAHTAFERGTVRVDDGVREGDAISPFYDSMVAKLIVHGDTREQALARLDAALAETRIVGLSTNVQFLRHVAASASFAQAKLDTALIPREAAVLFNQDRVGRDQAVAAAVAQTLLGERAAEGADPFSRRDGFRSHGLTVRRFDFEYQGEGLLAYLTYERGGALTLKVGDTAGPLVFEPVGNGDRFELQFADRRQVVQTWTQGETVHVFTPVGATQILEIDALAHAGEAAHEGGRLTAPMPGKVVSFAVKAGDAVTKGQPLAVMEAMKMEHTIAAPADGTVEELLYAPGDQVNEGAELLRLVAA
ncbi:MAG: biotin/lipoyl-containing protein, partial [Hydrogenophaga sp.]